MNTMSISQFKAHALRVIEEISKTRQGLIITKRGKPIAEVMPYREKSITAEPGKLSEYLVFEEDIVSPLGDAMWEATR